jgi:hypothetical protein
MFTLGKFVAGYFLGGAVTSISIGFIQVIHPDLIPFEGVIFLGIAYLVIAAIAAKLKHLNKIES